MKKIGMVVALEQELIGVLSELGEYRGTRRFGKIKIDELRYMDAELYIAESGVGEISAAIASTYLILECGAEIIVNFGVVGSLTTKYKAGDTVIVRETVHYDFTAMMSDGEAWGKYLDNRDTFVNFIDEKALEIIKSALGDGVKFARIASGDKFVDNTEFKNWLVGHFGCEICDMESAGIYFACKNADIPLIMIKSVSDNADESANVDFSEVVKTGVKYYLDALKKILAVISIAE